MDEQSSKDDPAIAAEGLWGRVEYARRADRTMPAKLYVQSLTKEEGARIRALFKMMADVGQIWNRTKFKQIEGEIFEFKSHQVRVSCWRVGNCWYLLDGFTKKQDNWKLGELKHAQNLLEEHKRVLS